MQHVISSDGTRIAMHRSGSGPPLLLVHGTTADHTRWAQVVPAFERSFTVYAMDRRGRGGSGDASAYSLEQEGRDVAAAVAAVGEPVALLGHSYGAICCLEAALQSPPGIARMVLYEPPVPVGPPVVPAEVREELEARIARGEREAALLTFFRDVVRVPEAHLEALKAHPAWPGRVAAAHTVVREVRIEAEYRLDFDALRGVRLPTLLLLGGASPPFFREATRRVHEALPDSRIVELPGQQHLAMDAIPDEFVEIVRSFVLPVPGAAAGER
jgi:pimeloyl-ACP methyl ester carboxylesterase